jgi:hypothetical protein
MSIRAGKHSRMGEQIAEAIMSVLEVDKPNDVRCQRIFRGSSK